MIKENIKVKQVFKTKFRFEQRSLKRETLSPDNRNVWLRTLAVVSI